MAVRSGAPPPRDRSSGDRHDGGAQCAPVGRRDQGRRPPCQAFRVGGGGDREGGTAPASGVVRSREGDRPHRFVRTSSICSSVRLLFAWPLWARAFSSRRSSVSSGVLVGGWPAWFLGGWACSFMVVPPASGCPFVRARTVPAERERARALETQLAA